MSVFLEETNYWPSARIDHIWEPSTVEGPAIYSYGERYLFQEWICLFCLHYLSQHHYLIAYNAEFTQAWDTQYSIQLEDLHNSEGGWEWNPLEVSPRSNQPHRMLEWPPKGVTEVPAQRKGFAVMQ